MTADNVQAAGEQIVKLITLNKNWCEALNTGRKLWRRFVLSLSAFSYPNWRQRR